MLHRPQHRRFDVPPAHLLRGTLVTAALLFIWFTGRSPLNPFVTALLIGGVSGILLRTWWSVIAVPLVSLVVVATASLVRDRPASADSGDITAAGAAALGVVLLALIGAGAALGTALGKWLHGDDRTWD